MFTKEQQKSMLHRAARSSNMDGRYVWRRQEDGSVMRFYEGTRPCCVSHRLTLVRKFGTPKQNVYFKCYECGREWTEDIPLNPMEAVQITPMPTRQDGKRKSPPIPIGAIIVHP